MSKAEKRYIVARSDWHATQALKKIYQGRMPSSVLANDFQSAVRRIRSMRLVKQEEYSIFEVTFRPDQVYAS